MDAEDAQDDGLGERLDDVRQRVADAARAAGRAPTEITTVVVTKFQPLELIERLDALGVRDFGESRHPEARDKALALPGATWHFVGRLQTNKARQVARYSFAIHSIDTPELVDAIAKGEARPRLFVQVDLAGDDPKRGGTTPDAAPALAERVLAAGLPLAGVMAVAPQGADPGRAFALLRAVSDRVIALDPQAHSISAGMSGDFAAAIREGSTHVRIGTAITGARRVDR